MTLRLAAGLSLALGIAALLGFVHVLCSGPFVSAEARHLRAMKERRGAPAVTIPLTVPLLDSLPSHHPLAEYAPLERRGVTLEGIIQYMLRAPDGDTHLEVAPGAIDSAGRYITAEITPGWYHDAPRWSYESLLRTFRTRGGNAADWDAPPRRVRVTGWLLYDYQYDPLLPGGRRREARRMSGWEVHPVTRIEVWNDAGGAFAEVTR